MILGRKDSKSRAPWHSHAQSANHRPFADDAVAGLRFTRPRADGPSKAMRTHGFRTHVLLVLAGAAVLVASLSRPWYARAPKPKPDHTQNIGDVNGPLNGLFHAMVRWVSDSHGVTGWHALGPVGTAIAGLGALAALSALGATTPAVQSVSQDVLRWSAFAVAGLVAWRVFDPPHANDVWELRHGALVAAFAAIMLFAGAMPVASAPRRRRTVTPAYAAPTPPPAVVDTTGSVAPPPGGPVL
jgi:hypothetical protein